ncbi:hypothetical protein M0802_009162 [Mischocyttarus mexicanus]|nr:hypothetical protein M0802_009162 [Mischocyttarus mexicanus]
MVVVKKKKKKKRTEWKGTRVTEVEGHIGWSLLENPLIIRFPMGKLSVNVYAGSWKVNSTSRRGKNDAQDFMFLPVATWEIWLQAEMRIKKEEEEEEESRKEGEKLSTVWLSPHVREKEKEKWEAASCGFRKRRKIFRNDPKRLSSGVIQDFAKLYTSFEEILTGLR